MRVMQEFVIPTDDVIPVRISYPSELSADEFQDVEETVAIWLRQLRRNIREQIVSTNGLSNKSQSS